MNKKIQLCTVNDVGKCRIIMINYLFFFFYLRGKMLIPNIKVVPPSVITEMKTFI